MASVPTDFFWSSVHQTAYREACPGLFLDPGKPSKLIALKKTEKACMPVANSPTLSQDSASTKVESEKTGSYGIQNETSTDLQHVVIDTDDGLESYHQSATGDRKFIIRHNDHSWSRLNVTKSLFDGLCFHLQISDGLKYMITYFGEKSRCDEIRPPLPQCQITQDRDGRSSLESCYTLRYIALNQNNDAENPWSLRQFAVYSRQRETEYSSWLLIAPPEAVVSCIASPLSEASDKGFMDFALHLVLIEYAVACWRPYIYYLTEEVDKCNEKLEFAAPPALIKIDLAMLRLRLKNLEDQVEDAKVSVQSNEAVMRTMIQLCAIPSYAHDDPRMKSADNSSHIAEKCSNYLLVAEAMTSQLQSLRNKILSCTEITSSFSELANGKALQEIASSANIEAQRAASDAAAMKALTIIASIFLPTTVVLNFFSAQFINNSGDHMRFADNWWLFVAVSGPLTISTLIIWTLWMQYQRRKSSRSKDDPANIV